MNTNKKAGFKTRSFTSVLTALSFIMVVITGIILFIQPSGRIAHETNWTLLALSKWQWGALHVWTSIIFVAASGFHGFLNWRALASYFKNKAIHRYAFKPEWILALLICLGVCAGVIFEVHPFSTLINYQRSLKHGWSNTQNVQGPLNPAPDIRHGEANRNNSGNPGF